MKSLLVGVVLFLLVSTISAVFVDHSCIYDEMVQFHKQNSTGRTTKSTPRSVPYPADDFPSATNTQPIRIVIDSSYLDNDSDYTCYNVGQQITVSNVGTELGNPYTCTAEDILTSSVRDYLIKTLVPSAINLLHKTFNVVPVQGNLVLSPGTCPGSSYGVPIPSSYTSTGVANADLVVFVLARPVVGSTALAYAAGCEDDQYGRTIEGYININPASTSSESGAFPSQLGTVIHELSHVLGFNNDKFSYLRASDNTYFSGLNNGMITTPKVKTFAQTYFGCSTLGGASIEDGGGAGTSGSHWEKEQWMNEYMTGISTQNPVFSELTLSFFQDSGWYYINMDQAQQLFFGYKKGCNFAQGCANWPNGQGYTCSLDNEKDECTFDLQGKGYCDTDILTGDYSCPYVQGYSDAWCIDSDDATKTLLDSGEVYGPSSRCFSSSLIKATPTGGTSQLVCYKTACVGPTLLKVWVDQFWYDCGSAGASVAVINYGGTITCPDPILICAGSSTAAEVLAQWPTISAISPTGGVPGSTVTIYGTNFYNISQVYIAGECTDVVVSSDTQLTAVLPTYDKIQNPSNFFKAKANVIVTNSAGHNDLAYQLYNLQIELNEDLAEAALRWVKDKWYVVIIAAVVLGVLILVCYRCCRTKKKEEHRQQKRQPNSRRNTGDVHMHQIRPQDQQYHDEEEYYEDDYAQQQQQQHHHHQQQQQQHAQQQQQQQQRGRNEYYA